MTGGRRNRHRRRLSNLNMVLFSTLWIGQLYIFLINFSAKLGWQHDSECTSLEGICNDETSLVIKQITESDSGLYRCRVHYQASPSQDYVIDVRLVGEYILTNILPRLRPWMFLFAPLLWVVP